MDHTVYGIKKKKVYVGIAFGIFAGLFLLLFCTPKIGLNILGIDKEMLPSVSAYSGEQGENEIGYEFLDDNKVVHIWNNIDDYYFNESSGIQFTNHYNDYWTKNIFCIGYYSGEEWVKIKCADELSDFNRMIDTDNSTYVNATLWKDISYGGYNLRLGVNYFLGLNDQNLSVTIYGKNIGDDIPFDLGFAWKVTDWDITPSEIILHKNLAKLFLELDIKLLKNLCLLNPKAKRNLIYMAIGSSSR